MFESKDNYHQVARLIATRNREGSDVETDKSYPRQLSNNSLSGIYDD